MGRWVTSKGRRIYIPDEGEENPYIKNAAEMSKRNEEDRQRQNDAIRNLRSKGMGIQEAQKTVKNMSRNEREKAAQEYREKSGGKTNYRDKEESIKQKQIADNKRQADERNGKKKRQVDKKINKQETLDTYYQKSLELSMRADDPRYKERLRKRRKDK